MRFRLELSVSTLFCLEEPLEKVQESLLGLPVKNIELVDTGPHTLNPERVYMLNQLASSNNLNYTIHAQYSDINLSVEDPILHSAILRRIEQSLIWANKLEAKAVVFHPGSPTALERLYPGRAWQKNLETIREIVILAEDYSVDAMVENVPDPYPFLLKTVDDFERFYNEIDFNIMMVLDVAHANICGEIEEYIDRFSDRIGHVHVSDNNGDVDNHMPVGTGSIDWSRVIDSLKSTGYNGYLTIESYTGIIESINYLAGLL